MQEGTLVDGYRVVRKLGQGAMGAVFEAVHEQDDRRAAIKVLHAQFTGDTELVTRFFNEARAANIIDHPGVVKVYGSGKMPDGSSYLAMEFLEGESLKARLKGSGGRLKVNMLEIAVQIAAALAAAHERKIIHRDLKPDNIMIVPDPEAPGGERVKILDFGIAKLLDMEDVGVKTAAGVAMGTPTYMSPEQFTGAGEVTAKADVYSLGVILYHFVAGRPPFLAKGPGELLQLHMQGQVLPLRQLEPGVNETLAELVHRMLGKRPEERPSMQEVRDTLQALSTGGVVPAATSGASPMTRLPAERLPAPPREAEAYEGTMIVRPGAGGSRRWIVVAAGVLMAALLTVAGVLLLRRAPEPAPPPPPAAPASKPPPPAAPPAPPAEPTLKEEAPPPAEASQTVKKKVRRRR